MIKVPRPLEEIPVLGETSLPVIFRAPSCLRGRVPGLKEKVAGPYSGKKEKDEEGSATSTGEAPEASSG